MSSLLAIPKEYIVSERAWIKKPVTRTVTIKIKFSVLVFAYLIVNDPAISINPIK